LTTRERRFVCEYLIDGNGAAAARRSGYSARTARVIAWQNLAKPNIGVAVRAGLDLIMARCAINTEKVVHELSTIAFSNLLNYEFDDQGFVTIVEEGPPEAIKALASITCKRVVTGQGAEIITSEIRLHDKLHAIEMLGRKLQLWTEKIEVEDVQTQVYTLLLQHLKSGEQQ
jgi:phage terminase small subunit